MKKDETDIKEVKEFWENLEIEQNPEKYKTVLESLNVGIGRKKKIFFQPLFHNK